MVDAAVPPHDPVARAGHAEPEVGVLPIGPGEPLVETSDGGEGGPAVCDVGGGPPGALQATHVALPVGRHRWQRHGDPALARPDVGTKTGEIGGEIAQPRPGWDDVVVEEHDPLGARSHPTRVAGSCRAPATARDHDGDRSKRRRNRLARTTRPSSRPR